MQVDINTTEDFMGDIMSDLSSRRGRPQGMEAKGKAQIVKATVPMAEMLTYAPALRSMTPGPFQLHDGLLPLRGGPAPDPGEDHRGGEAGGGRGLAPEAAAPAHTGCAGVPAGF